MTLKIEVHSMQLQGQKKKKSEFRSDLVHFLQIAEYEKRVFIICESRE